jgi:hypothetical protein
MDETWAKCTENPAYEVSTLGRFRSLNGKINTRKPHAAGYMRVYVKSVGVRQLHILVAKAFIPNDDPTKKTVVNHIDGNRSNNCVTNLEWATPSENARLRTVHTTPAVNEFKNEDLPGEIWRDVSFEGVQLRASTLGRIELRSGTKTFGSNSADGYKAVAVIKGTSRRVHRIVCTAFHGQPASLDLVVNHKDFNRSNNVPSNLEWSTLSENVVHGLGNRGKVLGHNRRKVCQYTPDKSTLIAIHDNISAAALATGANRCAIVQMCRKWKGRTYNTIGGFFWEYAPE